MRKSITILTALSLLILVGITQVSAEKTPGELVSDAKAQILHVSVSIAKDLFDSGNYIFVDVREPAETKMGNIPGAILIPRGVLEFRIASAVEDKNAKIVVYCKSGGRSSLSTLALKTLGYTNVVSMDGGWTGWEEAGYPVGD